MPLGVLGALVSGVVFLNIAPYAFWYTDVQLLPNFVQDAKEIYEGDKNLAELYKNRAIIYQKYWWVASLALMIFFTYYFLESSGFMQLQGVWRIGGPFFFLDYLLLMMIGLYCGIGVMGFLSIQLLMHDFSSTELSIDPLHPDKRGGLSAVGYGAIKTTLLLSLGSFLLPWGFQFLRSGKMIMVSYPMVFAYVVIIAVSFIYPTVKIYNRADDLRSKILEEKRTQYKKLKKKLTPHKKIGLGDNRKEHILELKIQRIRKEYEDYKQASLYPIEIEIMTRLISSMILPVLFLLAELY